MIKLKLISEPIQTLTCSFNDVTYDITIRFCENDLTTYDIDINQIRKISGFKLKAFSSMLIFNYLKIGDFFMETENNETIDYKKFGTSQNLYYVESDEL